MGRFLSASSLLLFLLLATLSGRAGPVGMFQGELMSPPQAGWLYVKGRNGMLRRVELGKARIVYGRAVPLGRRDPNPSDDLIKGAVVKVTAEQGADGEWRAREVVLVHLSASQRYRATAARALYRCYPESRLVPPFPQRTREEWGTWKVLDPVKGELLVRAYSWRQ